MISASLTPAELAGDPSQASRYSFWLQADTSSDVVFSYQLTVGARWPIPDKVNFKPLLLKSPDLHQAAKDLATLQGRSADDIERKLSQEDGSIRQKYGLKPSRKRDENQLDRLEKLVGGTLQTPGVILGVRNQQAFSAAQRGVAKGPHQWHFDRATSVLKCRPIGAGDDAWIERGASGKAKEDLLAWIKGFYGNVDESACDAEKVGDVAKSGTALLIRPATLQAMRGQQDDLGAIQPPADCGADCQLYVGWGGEAGTEPRRRRGVKRLVSSIIGPRW